MNIGTFFQSSTYNISTRLIGNSVPNKALGNSLPTKLVGNIVPTKLFGNSVPTESPSEQYTLYNPASGAATLSIKVSEEE